MQLYDYPENPCPDGAVLAPLRALDGVALRAAFWPSLSARPTGTICLFQGRAEFIEKYYEVIGDLRSRGFAVATLDWRGQGGSDRLLPDPRPGHVVDFTGLGLDLDAFMQRVVQQQCPEPFYALAHSMGATALFFNLEGRRRWFSRLVMTAPMLAIQHAYPGSGLLVRLLCSLGLSSRIAPGWTAEPMGLRPFTHNRVTSDPQRYRLGSLMAQTTPQLAIGGPTIGWIKAAFAMMERLNSPQFARDWSVPTLVCLAGGDRVVSSQAAGQFASRFAAMQVVTLEGAQHEIMNERDALRVQFWNAFDSFITPT